jgi:adenylylsulfate reductase subunit A
MAIPNKPTGELPAVANPEIVEKEVDILIVGGGMAACGTAFEIKKWAPDAKILLCDKAAMERSGAVAQGLSAINTYLGENDPADYVKWFATTLWALFAKTLFTIWADMWMTPSDFLRSGVFPSGSKKATKESH